MIVYKHWVAASIHACMLIDISDGEAERVRFRVFPEYSPKTSAHAR